MERRSTGIALLALVALAVLFLPVIGGKRVPGAAQAAEVPTVNGCLTDLANFSVEANITLDDGVPSAPLPAGVPGGCSAPGAARVIAVRFGVDLPKIMNLRDMFSEATALCGPALTALGDGWNRTGWIWKHDGRQIGIRTDMTLAAQLVVPDDGSSSRHWVACVPVGASGVPSVVDVTADWIRNEFGHCFFKVPVGPGTSESISVPCGLDHNVEELGSVFQTGGRATEDDYQAACRAFAVDATGMADPTAGGRLAVEAVDDGSWNDGPGSCRISVVDPNQRLSGSLLGIGTAPLPWSR